MYVRYFWQENHQIYGHIRRVGEKRIRTLYMTVSMVISLLKIPYLHRMYVCIYAYVCFCQPYITVFIYGSGQPCKCAPCAFVAMVLHRLYVCICTFLSTLLYGIYIYIDILGWPKPYIYTVYDCIFGGFPAKNTVYTPYIYGFGQPYIYIRFWPTLQMCAMCICCHGW